MKAWLIVINLFFLLVILTSPIIAVIFLITPLWFVVNFITFVFIFAKRKVVIK